MKNLKILVDDREPKSIDAIVKIVGGMDFERKRLKTGDYIFNGIVIERKTIDDLCGSIIDGRMKSQAEKMLKKYKKVIVLISGRIQDRTSEIHENCILGVISSLINKGISVACVDDDWQLLYLMRRIFERSCKEEDILEQVEREVEESNDRVEEIAKEAEKELRRGLR